MKTPVSSTRYKIRLGMNVAFFGLYISDTRPPRSKIADLSKDELHISLSWEDKKCHVYVYGKSYVADDKKDRSQISQPCAATLEKQTSSKTRPLQSRMNDWSGKGLKDYGWVSQKSARLTKRTLGSRDSVVSRDSFMVSIFMFINTKEQK